MRKDVDRSLTGKIGRVTGRIGPGTIGEVMLPYLGGIMAFHAHPFDKTSDFPVGSEVLVIYYEPPQTVYVDELPDVLKHAE
ncbi:hypothetical protein OUO20_06230 [Arthrobacter sp. FX8]|jgi:hypothetical protein|uniref:hypothetical protein n=1 Tax=Micrococcaceae TaxID=1268 RepID=UPI0006FE4241|nr:MULTISPECIES: hypothetical protein [unclassified Arthrobacter]KRE73078.1 hypothetical protein ASG79_02825 [Arthrobacter sp. Soil761]TWD56188.1 hypothetical protein FB478_101333 [Arthrobacter sp. AG367]WAJ34514.1 hypothetical protein OUO20_06230 [Arthrobacter sp. FX8]BCW75540.1 hypothetical protein NicSoilB11_18650 [Arthrobacter sp. NicSoilB11]